MPLIPFAVRSTPGEDAAAYSGERLVNYFARPIDGVSNVALMARSGLVQHAYIGAPVAALTEMGGDLYAVAGGAVWRVGGGSVANVGAVPTGPARLAASGRQVAIVAGGRYFVCDGATTVEVSPGVLTTVVDVAYMDGYFILVGADINRGDAIQITALDDGATLNALEFAYAEESPDPLVGVLRDHGELYMFGTQTTQIFYNAGAADFPFLPNKGALIEHGCLSAATLAKADNAVFWVRPDRAVVRSSGSTPQVISTPEVKEELLRSTVTGGFTFSDRGSEFYAVTRDGNTTLVFDIAAQLWHERSTGLEYEPWAALNRATFGGVEYFGCACGRIGVADQSTWTDFGGVMASEAISRPIEAGGEQITIAKVHVNLRGGEDDIGRAPEIMLQASRDGRTWGAERWREMGQKGEHWKRMAWHGFGASRRFQFRLRVTDPVARDIYGAKYE